LRKAHSPPADVPEISHQVLRALASYLEERKIPHDLEWRAHWLFDARDPHEGVILRFENAGWEGYLELCHAGGVVKMRSLSSSLVILPYTVACAGVHRCADHSVRSLLGKISLALWLDLDDLEAHLG